MTSAICRCIIRNIFSDVHPSFPSAYSSISSSIYILSCSMEPSEMKRPFVQKSERESSALELFKGLQTLLITFKAVVLKALSKALRMHPLFKSIASSKFHSQRLSAKLLRRVTEPMSCFCIVLQCQRDQFIGDLCFPARPISWGIAVLAALLTTSTQALFRAKIQARGSVFSVISTLLGKALAQDLPQVICHLNDQASAHSELHSLVFPVK